MRPSPDPRASGARITELDGMRGIAALGVLVFHAWLYTMPVPDASDRSTVSDYLVHELRLGLIMFFALSGFVLFRPWVRAALDGSARPSLRRYAHARTARILPAYYFALAGSIALLWGLAGHPGVRLPAGEDLWRFVFFAQNFSGDTIMSFNTPTWSLVIEVCFYVVLPVLGWITLKLPSRRAALLTVPVVLAAAGFAWTWMAQEQGLPLPWRKSLPAMLPYFATGMAAAILIHARSLTGPRARWMLAAGAALVLVDAAMQSLHAAGIVQLPWATIWRDFPAAVGFALLIAAVAARPRPAETATRARRGLLGSRPVIALGTVSYGFYLWHMPILLWGLANGVVPTDPVLLSLVVAPVALAVAALSWVVLERPALARVDARRQRSSSTLRRSREALASRSGTPPVIAREAAAPTNPPGALNSLS